MWGYLLGVVFRLADKVSAQTRIDLNDAITLLYPRSDFTVAPRKNTFYYARLFIQRLADKWGFRKRFVIIGLGESLLTPFKAFYPSCVMFKNLRNAKSVIERLGSIV
jgi:hypothetical protein